MCFKRRAHFACHTNSELAVCVFFFQNMNMAFNCALSKVACVRLDSSCACKACLTTSPLLSIFRVLLWTWLSCFLKDPESSDKSLGACTRVVGGRSSTGNEQAIALGVFSSCLFTPVCMCDVVGKVRGSGITSWRFVLHNMERNTLVALEGLDASCLFLRQGHRQTLRRFREVSSVTVRHHFYENAPRYNWCF